MRDFKGNTFAELISAKESLFNFATYKVDFTDKEFDHDVNGYIHQIFSRSREVQNEKGTIEVVLIDINQNGYSSVYHVGPKISYKITNGKLMNINYSMYAPTNDVRQARRFAEECFLDLPIERIFASKDSPGIINYFLVISAYCDRQKIIDLGIACKTFTIMEQ